LNTTKGAILPIGTCSKRDTLTIQKALPLIFSNIPILTKGQQERYLGVPVPSLPGKKTDKEWERRHKSITKQIAHWTTRQTTIQGRIAVVNSLLYSKIYYHLASRYISQSAVTKLFSRPAHQFIWRQRKYHPATSNLFPSRSEGGFNLMDIQARVIALRIRTISNLLHRTDAIASLIKGMLYCC
jgi:hypothetical protein